MKLIIKLNEINYGDVAIKAMPLLKQTAQQQHALGKLMEALSELPHQVVYEVFDSIPKERKDDIVAAIAADYQEKMLEAINGLSEKNQLGIHVAELTIDKELLITATMDAFDYACVINRFVPPSMQAVGTAASKWMGMLGKWMGENTDAFVVHQINRHQQALMTGIEKLAARQDIRLKIQSIVLEA